MKKIFIPQSVFDSPQALAIAKAGHKQACADLARKHPSDLGEGNPNHPKYESLFGYERNDFMNKQYRR